ncbi:MAG: AraC family transcriptional regulator [Planctomycetes bacterium]|nr:AraC family transcriptional regulator [Planctomycetota bacterium]
MQETRPYLSNHRMLHTRDLSESRAVTSRMWEHHRVTVRGTDPFETTINGIAKCGMGISYVDCRTPLLMEFEPVQNNYYLQIALEGEVEHLVNGRRAMSNPDLGVLHGPGQALRMDSTAVRLLLLSIDSTVLLPAMKTRGLPTTSLEDWALTIDFKSAEGQALADHCRWAANELSTPGSTLAKDEGFSHLRAMFSSLVVDALANNAPSWKSTEGAWLGGCTIDDLTEWLRANIRSPLGMAELAARTGVSSRAVQKAFQRHFGCSPTRFITNLRLEDARRQIFAHSDRSLSEVAISLGFLHYGRFAAAYFNRFGELPSQTMVQSRKRDS